MKITHYEWLWLTSCVLLVILVIAYGSSGSLCSLRLSQRADEKPEEDPDYCEEAVETSALLSDSSNLQSDFFLEYKLERERVRSQQMDILRELFSNPKAGEIRQDEGRQVLLEASQKMEMEMEAEGLIKAKGFNDAIVFTKGSKVHVVIKSKELEEKDAVQIGDLIRDLYQIELEQIIIDCHD